jgi:beta-mannosidase
VRAESFTPPGHHPTHFARAALILPNPALWWPHGYGEQALYDLDISLWRGDTRLDTFRDRVGIRTVKLDQSHDPDEVGTQNFTLVVNGVPIFAKGANWIPADLLNGRVNRARYAELLRLLVEANGNMLRVWGGGQYEQDDFYRLADEMGVMIWHDFMFSCALYPDDDAQFVHEVRIETEYQLRRLRNRASVVLWVGNNENDWIEDMRHWEQPGHDFGGKRLYHEVLPEVVARLDPSRPYWPSSPYGGNDHNSAECGDRHNWCAWHGQVQPRHFGEEPQRDWSPYGVSYRRYAEDKARFISEFGLHALPVFETLRRNVPASEHTFGSPDLLFRNKDDPKNKGDMLMLAHTGLPKDLPEYIDFSMICQAEGLKFAVEHYRRRKFHCSGTLIWQWNDCWPGLTWSLLDYYAFPKAGYFFVKRAFAPVMASFKDEPDGSVSLWLVNDTLSPLDDALTWVHGTFNGDILSQGEVNAHVPPNSVIQMARITPEILGTGNRQRQYLWVRSSGGHFPDNRHFFAEIKDLVRHRPNVQVVWHQDGDALIADISTDTYAYFARLFVPLEGTRYSDNWFDVPPGETRRVRIWHPGGRLITPEMVEVNWR